MYGVIMYKEKWCEGLKSEHKDRGLREGDRESQSAFSFGIGRLVLYL